MPKPNAELEDLTHLLIEVLNEEGHDVDSEVEREVIRLAKFVLAKGTLSDDAEEAEEEDGYPELDPEELDWPSDDEDDL